MPGEIIHIRVGVHNNITTIMLCKTIYDSIGDYNIVLIFNNINYPSLG